MIYFLVQVQSEENQESQLLNHQLPPQKRKSQLQLQLQSYKRKQLLFKKLQHRLKNLDQQLKNKFPNQENSQGYLLPLWVNLEIKTQEDKVLTDLHIFENLKKLHRILNSLKSTNEITLISML